MNAERLDQLFREVDACVKCEYRHRTTSQHPCNRCDMSGSEFKTKKENAK